MKVKVSRSNKEPQAGDCYHVADQGPCLLVVNGAGTYQFVVLETGIGFSAFYATAKELVDNTDCRRINDSITLSPD